MKHTVTLEIAGTKYRFVSDADEERLQQLAELVNERVDEKKSHRVATSSHVLAMAALNLADDLLEAQERLREAEARLEQVDGLTRTTLTHAIARIDRRLSEDDPQG